MAICWYPFKFVLCGDEVRIQLIGTDVTVAHFTRREAMVFVEQLREMVENNNSGGGEVIDPRSCHICENIEYDGWPGGC